MRDNQERFSVAPDGDPATVSSNGLSFVSPTELVPLPSKGKYYSENHPLHGKEEIEIKYMTAKEEDILSNKSLLKKGVAIDRMLQSLIVDKSIKLESLLIGDKNAILIAARISAYGPEYASQVTCPQCETRQKFEFDLSDLKEKDCSSLEDQMVSANEKGNFAFKLPRSKVDVEIKTMTVGDEAKITQELMKKKDVSYMEQMKAIVLSVNGETNRGLISSFVENLIASDARHIRKVMSSLLPDIDMTQTFLCSSCDHEEEMEVPLTAEFFWPK
jgi:hypothetical protein